MVDRAFEGHGREIRRRELPDTCLLRLVMGDDPVGEAAEPVEPVPRTGW